MAETGATDPEEQIRADLNKLYNPLGRGKRTLSQDWSSMIQDTEHSKHHGYRGRQSHLEEVIIPHNVELTFCTGSEYSGKWNKLGMTVYGRYLYPHGCEYEGGFEDGMFHGEGTLIYPMGQKLEGYWEKGKLLAYKFTNVDGLDYDEDWAYCRMPDRRFTVCIQEGLQPASREYVTNQQSERPLEQGQYDTGDGFYDPVKRMIIPARDPQDYDTLDDRKDIILQELEEEFWANSVTMVSKETHQWIVTHCRKGGDEAVGYRPDIYEDWITGRRSELEHLNEKYKLSAPSTPNASVKEEGWHGSTSISLNNKVPSLVDYACTGRKLSKKISPSR